MNADDMRLDELDELVRESERSMRELEQAMHDLRQLSGTGKSRTGVVSARVDAANKLVELVIGPRATRLGSADLSREVIEAVTAAQLDQERQARALIGVLPDGEGLLGSFQRDVAGMKDAYTAETNERLDRMRRGRRE